MSTIKLLEEIRDDFVSAYGDDPRIRKTCNVMINEYVERTSKKVKDLNYWKSNCEEDYLKTPISVLRYITKLEEKVEEIKSNKK